MPATRMDAVITLVTQYIFKEGTREAITRAPKIRGVVDAHRVRHCTLQKRRRMRWAKSVRGGIDERIGCNRGHTRLKCHQQTGHRSCAIQVPQHPNEHRWLCSTI